MASVYQKRGRGTWYLRVKDAAGRWVDIASTAQTKTEARRLAAELERKAERQRLGLEPLPTDCTLNLGQLVEWWLRERCPPASHDREESRLRTTSCRVSRVGIEPTTLGLKGRVSLSHGVARVRKLAPILDKSRPTIPSVIKLWHRFRSGLLTGC